MSEQSQYGEPWCYWICYGEPMVADRDERVMWRLDHGPVRAANVT